MINTVDRGKKPTIEGLVEGRSIEWLVDTGACVTVVDCSHGIEWSKFHRTPADFEELVGPEGSAFPVICSVIVPVILKGKTFFAKIHVVEKLMCRAIMGADLIKQSKCEIRLWKDQISFAHEWKPGEIHNCLGDKETEGMSLIKIKENVTIPRGFQAKIKLITNKGDTEGIATCNDATFAECAVKTGRVGEFVSIATNNSTKDITYKKGQTVGIFEEIFKGSHEASSVNAVIGDPVEFKPKAPSPISAKKRSYLLQEIDLSHLDKHQKGEVWKLIEMFHDTFSESDHDLGKTSAVKHEISLTHKNPIHISQFTLPWEHRKVVEDYVQELLDKKCIRTSFSPYNAPIFCVKKPHGNGWRIVCDYRQLNLATKEDKYVIRTVQSCLDEIGRKDSKIFSALDLTHGFWQLALSEDSSAFTAFTVPGWGRFEWTSAPMGLNGSPSTFARLMDWVMQGLSNILCFIDDVLAHSRNFEEHMVHLKEAFQRLRNFGLKLKPRKCLFARRSVPYLGFIISDEGIRPSTEKTQAIKDFKEPRTQKQIREFVGLCNYFRSMIPGYTQMAGKLTELLKNSNDWDGGPLPPAAQKAFNDLKTKLTSAPILAYPKEGIEFHLYTDACTGDAFSAGGFGAVLTQWQEGKERVISYFSRTMQKHERNYSAFLAELAAATLGIEAFSTYLTGRKFTLWSDHRPLEKVAVKHEKTLKRLQQQMLEYNFKIRYKKGETNKVADALSRNAREEEEQTLHPDEVVINYLDKQYLPPEDLFVMQQQDPMCKDIHGAHAGKGFTTRRDIVERTFVHHDVVFINLDNPGEEVNTAVFAPKAMHGDILAGCHNSPQGGHMGITKTRTNVKRQFWWPEVDKDVEDWVKSCRTCQEVKDPPRWHAHRQPMKEMPVCDAPNQRVHIDLFGPLKTSEKGKKYVMVMADAFSKYVVLQAISNKEAATVAKALHERWNLLFGAPREIVSDRGKEFDNKVVRELCTQFGIKRILTSAFHPQSNGQAERFNRTMIQYLKAMMDGDNTLDWELWLPSLAFSYNTQVQRSTNMTPFFLTFKHEAKLPFDIDAPRSYGTSYLSEALFRLREGYQMAKASIMRTSKKNKENYDKKSRDKAPFEVGQKVLLHCMPGQGIGNPKLKRTWVAGYSVAEVKGNDAYVLEHEDSRKHRTVANADRMKPEQSYGSKEESSRKSIITRTIEKGVTAIKKTRQQADEEKFIRRSSRLQQKEEARVQKRKQDRMEFSPFSLPAAFESEAEEPAGSEQELESYREEEETEAETSAVQAGRLEQRELGADKEALETIQKSKNDEEAAKEWSEDDNSEDKNFIGKHRKQQKDVTRGRKRKTWTEDSDEVSSESSNSGDEEERFMEARRRQRTQKTEKEKERTDRKQQGAQKERAKERKERQYVDREHRGKRKSLRERWALRCNMTSDDEEDMEVSSTEPQKAFARCKRAWAAFKHADNELMRSLACTSSPEKDGEEEEYRPSYYYNGKIKDMEPTKMTLRARNVQPAQKVQQNRGQTNEGKRPRLDHSSASE